MNATRSILAALLVSAVAVPAFADEGTPPALESRWAAQQTAQQSDGNRFVPQYLVGVGGEETLVQNPAFRAAQTARTPAQVIISESAPRTRYVGA